MELFDVMIKRRSVREYADEDISNDDLDKIIKAGLLAPSSRNRKPCELVVVRNKKTLRQLSLSKKSGSAMLEKANAAIVVVADSVKADTWIEDSSIVLTYMDLMAANLGIGSCWCQTHLRYSGDDKLSEDVVRGLLSLDDNYRIVGILSLGVMVEELDSHEVPIISDSVVKFMD